jgi:hypothetical protein
LRHSPSRQVELLTLRLLNRQGEHSGSVVAALASDYRGVFDLFLHEVQRVRRTLRPEAPVCRKMGPSTRIPLLNLFQQRMISLLNLNPDAAAIALTPRAEPPARDSGSLSSNTSPNSQVSTVSIETPLVTEGRLFGQPCLRSRTWVTKVWCMDSILVTEDQAFCRRCLSALESE